MAHSAGDRPTDVSAACVKAMEDLEVTELSYVPPWERRDQSEPWSQFEPGTHIMASIGVRFFESANAGSLRRV